jgi:hypothetical protein
LIGGRLAENECSNGRGATDEIGDLEDGIEFARGVDDKGEFTVFRTDPVVRAAARE